ncbi:oligosaccharide flippase family protein, partial [Candidatus Bathyarchaeota archaeon]|nr:oligosaccharide flippase family protein [Candidatus Bathyarchaeota archaeon]
MSEDLFQIAEDSARGGFFLAGGLITSLALQAIAIFVLARLLGPDLYGIYTLSVVFPNLFLIFVDLGINQAIIRFSANLRVRGQHKQIARLIRNGLLFKLVIGLGLFLVCFALSDYLATDVLKRPDITVYIRFASTTIIARVITTTAFSAFVGLDRMEYSALTMNVEAFSKAVISILLVILGFSVMGALIGLVLSFLIGGILSSALLYFRLYQPLTSRQD